MSLSIAFDGNLLLQLSEAARLTPVPVKFALSYNEKVMYDFSNNGVVNHVAVPQGSVTNPRIILVFVKEGTIELSWDSLGANPTVFSANPSPPPEDVPVMLLMRHAPPAGQLYLTSSGVARGAVWLFE